jgi:hypothetical protein
MTMLEMARVLMQWPRPRVADVAGAVRSELGRLNLEALVGPGMRVAVPAGSRGITDIVPILRTVVAELKRHGAQVRVVAAMGSHGGGTAHGQREVLRHLGITAESVGAELWCGYETVHLGDTPCGLPVHCVQGAAECDAILLLGRVKVHTAFRYPIASGPQKVMAVGLGGPAGARAAHSRGAAGLGPAIEAMARVFMARQRVLGALGIIENAYEETARLAALRAEEIAGREPELLAHARSLFPTLPVERAHLLVVEEMGKNYSGTGMDTNVTGRWGIPDLPDPETPHFERIAVLGLSPESGGNANGVGLADLVTRRLVDAVDWDATYLNVMTTGFLGRAKVPVTAATDQQCLEMALRSLGLSAGTPVRAVRLKNTLHLQEFWATEPLLPELQQHPHVVAVGPLHPLTFDAEGRLLPAL